MDFPKQYFIFFIIIQFYKKNLIDFEQHLDFFDNKFKKDVFLMIVSKLENRF